MQIIIRNSPSLYICRNLFAFIFFLVKYLLTHFKNFIYFLIEWYLLYRLLLFSVKPQHESAIGIHISSPFWTSLHSSFPSHPSGKSLQSCPTLCDPIDGSPPGSPVPGILKARTLEWAAISFSNVWKWEVKVKSFSRVQLVASPWTVAYQAPPSMGFSRQESWSGVPLPSPSHPSSLIQTQTPVWVSWDILNFFSFFSERQR